MSAWDVPPMFETHKREYKVKTMKGRMIAVALTLALLAWLPATAQQAAAPQPSPQSQAQPAQGDSSKTCDCCAKMKDSSASKQACCKGKDMACCKKDSTDKQVGANCCSGKDGKQCAMKTGKGTGCCGKEVMACNSKEGKHCCGAHMCARAQS